MTAGPTTVRTAAGRVDSVVADLLGDVELRPGQRSAIEAALVDALTAADVRLAIVGEAHCVRSWATASARAVSRWRESSGSDDWVTVLFDRAGFKASSRHLVEERDLLEPTSGKA